MEALRRQLWRFEPSKDGKRYRDDKCEQGVSYWENGDDKRILYGAGATLFCVKCQRRKILLPALATTASLIFMKVLCRIRIMMSFLSSCNTPGIGFKKSLIVWSAVSESQATLRAGSVRVTIL